MQIGYAKYCDRLEDQVQSSSISGDKTNVAKFRSMRENFNQFIGNIVGKKKKGVNIPAELPQDGLAKPSTATPSTAKPSTATPSTATPSTATHLAQQKLTQIQLQTPDTNTKDEFQQMAQGDRQNLGNTTKEDGAQQNQKETNGDNHLVNQAIDGVRQMPQGGGKNLQPAVVKKGFNETGRTELTEKAELANTANLANNQQDKLSSAYQDKLEEDCELPSPSPNCSFCQNLSLLDIFKCCR